MPHVDELLGVTTLAAAGMLIAIAIAPLPSGVHVPPNASESVQTSTAPHSPLPNS
jgi:hypothetical protein